MRTKIIMAVIPIVLTALLAFITNLFFQQREENNRKDSVILSYEEKETTYYVDSVGWVTEKATYQRTLKELKKSKDETVIKNLELAKEIGIKNKDITSMTNSMATMNQKFKAETEYIKYDDLDEASKRSLSVVDSSCMVETEEFVDPWMTMKRIKVVGSDSSAYSYHMKMGITEFTSKKKTKYLDHKFFLTRAIVRLFERGREVKTIISDNPNVTITEVKHVNVVD